MSKSPKIPSPSKAAVAGIQADTELMPFKYLLEAASTLGKNVTIDGKEYKFEGLGQADTARTVSDKLAQTMLDLQREKSPEIIRQRLAELEAADPQGFAARKQLFDRIMADAENNPGRPVSSELQQQLQDELAKGAGFSDRRQEEQVREGVRGDQVKHGIYLGAAPTTEEAKTVLQAGDALRDNRQQRALDMLQSGTSPEDVAFRQLQQTLSNLGSFTNSQTPEAQFGQVSGAANGPVNLTGQSPNPNNFNPNAAGQGISNAFGIYNAQAGYQNGQANPWLAGLGIGASTVGALGNINPSWFGGGQQTGSMFGGAQ